MGNKRMSETKMNEGVKATNYLQAGAKLWSTIEGEVIEEAPLTLYVNGQEWVTMMCTPVGLEDLVLGFLSAEGIISGLEDVALIDITHRGAVADVWLRHQVILPQQRVLTSGCAGGTTFVDLAETRAPLLSTRQITRDQVLALMQQLQEAAVLYSRSQGVHASALSDGERLLAAAEDVGRHNTLDKIRGACLRRNIPTAGSILLTSGRISSEMLRKAADMEAPIVVSRTSPTSLSLALADAWNITLIGYVRGRRMRVYSGAWRWRPSIHPDGTNSHAHSHDSTSDRTLKKA